MTNLSCCTNPSEMEEETNKRTALPSIASRLVQPSARCSWLFSHNNRKTFPRAEPSVTERRKQHGGCWTSPSKPKSGDSCACRTLQWIYENAVFVCIPNLPRSLSLILLSHSHSHDMMVFSIRSGAYRANAYVCIVVWCQAQNFCFLYNLRLAVNPWRT